ncbi:ras-related protein Rab-23-like [Tenebrio molitor]
MDQSVVNPEEADLLARALGCRLLRTSVKEDVNVAAVFRHLAARCLAELRDPRDYDYFTTPTPHHPNSLTISAFSPSHSSKNHNGTIVLRPNKHKKKKNVLKNACRIL